MRPGKIKPLIVLALSGSVIVLYLLPEAPVLRPLIVLGFLLVGPGLAIVPFMRLPDLARELTLGLALSLALDISLTLIFLYSGAWSIVWMFAILLIISISGALIQLLSLPG